MKYIDVTTSEVLTESQIRSTRPNTIFPHPFTAPAGYAAVFDTPAPQVTILQRAQMIAPLLTNVGVYEWQWEVVDKFADHIDENDVLITKAAQEAEAVLGHAESERAYKAENVFEDYKAAIAALEAAYRADEKATWPQQVTEARAHSLDALASTPLIDAMLVARTQDTKGSLVTKILTNYAVYSAIVGAALGTMQTRTAALAAIDLSDVDALDQIAAI